MRGVRESDGRLVRQRVGQKCRARRPPHSLFVGKESAAGMKYTMQEVPSNYSRKGKLSFLLAVTTGRDNYLLSQFADSILGSVKSDTSLPADAAGAKLLADRIRDVSSEKPSEVRPTSKMAAVISGKVYKFPPNEANVRSLTLVLAGPQPHYEVETYADDATGVRTTVAVRP